MRDGAVTGPKFTQAQKSETAKAPLLGVIPVRVALKFHGRVCRCVRK